MIEDDIADDAQLQPQRTSSFFWGSNLIKFDISHMPSDHDNHNNNNDTCGKDHISIVHS